jgi:HAD superfamily hydrolase (TIGR01484 family)
MRPLAELSRARASKVRAVFTDIDDTLTTEGRLEAPAFDAIWRLHKAGIQVVPVTGRPAGWCDHIARMWPVAGVVGENGAFYYRHDPVRRSMVRRYALPETERAQLQSRLAWLGEAILKSVPGAQIASDQSFRIHDLAIDFTEDVPTLPRSEVDRIVGIFEHAGAVAKVSSIHVNGWFGDYDKLSMIRRIAEEVLDVDPSTDAALYVGDSPNDEPAFAAFSLSVGVANIREFEDRLRHPPAFVSRARGGRGFSEVARHLLKARAVTRSGAARTSTGRRRR